MTAAQARDVTERIIAAGHWHDGDPDIVVVFDAGYDLTGWPGCWETSRSRSWDGCAATGVMHLPAAAREPGANGRPSRHGAAFRLDGKQPWPAPAAATCTGTTRYGTATAMAWARLHQRLTSRAGWQDHDGELPVIEGTVIRLAVDHLPATSRFFSISPWAMGEYASTRMPLLSQ